MNENFLRVIGAKADERKDLFNAAATRIGTTIQNIEKDFWVTWVLDLLFNGRREGEPRLLFKGGTSLSKVFGLISRFSEDIDITVFREDIGKNLPVEALSLLSGKKQKHYLEELMQASQAYIQGQLQERLKDQMGAAFQQAQATGIHVELDPDDHGGQTLQIHYPSVASATQDYLKPMVKIEAGAKSALDPHQAFSIEPFISQDSAGLDLKVPNIVTIAAERTFWDKVIILHGLRHWYDVREEFQHQGHRLSRHYYDIHQLMLSGVGQRALTSPGLALDCATHAKLFFYRKDQGLESAQPGTFKIVPASTMTDALERDYRTMAPMIFGDVPDFQEVFGTILELEKKLNAGA